MLQQTQVSRVLEAWPRFLARFPTVHACASAGQDEVVRAWQGLGYARRARALHQAAQYVAREWDGMFSSDPQQLRQLPGVGDYTANAIASFAFDAPCAVLDTNVGRVLARALANRPLTKVEAQALADDLRGAAPSRAWNQAMLDLGAQFCRARPRCAECPVARVCAWQRDGGADPATTSAAVSRPQPRFAGSDREQRGIIVRAVSASSKSTAQLAITEGVDASRLERVLASLVRDGLVVERRRRWYLAQG